MWLICTDHVTQSNCLSSVNSSNSRHYTARFACWLLLFIFLHFLFLKFYFIFISLWLLMFCISWELVCWWWKIAWCILSTEQISLWCVMCCTYWNIRSSQYVFICDKCCFPTSWWQLSWKLEACVSRRMHVFQYKMYILMLNSFMLTWYFSTVWPFLSFPPLMIFRLLKCVLWFILHYYVL